MNDPNVTLNEERQKTKRVKFAWLGQSHYFIDSSLLFVLDQWIYMFTHTLTDNAAKSMFVVSLSFFLHRLQSEWDNCPRIPTLACIPEFSILRENDNFVQAVSRLSLELSTARKCVKDIEFDVLSCEHGLVYIKKRDIDDPRLDRRKSYGTIIWTRVSCSSLGSLW